MTHEQRNTSEEMERLLAEGDIGLTRAVKSSRKKHLGVLDTHFLGQSVGLLTTGAAVCVKETDTVRAAIDELRKRHIGCVLVSGTDGRLSGVFSERDILQKVILDNCDHLDSAVRDFMTRNPVTIDFTASMGYSLSLMSMGGFRHLPIVDEDNYPVGIISVKDIVLAITNKFVEDIMAF